MLTVPQTALSEVVYWRTAMERLRGGTKEKDTFDKLLGARQEKKSVSV